VASGVVTSLHRWPVKSFRGEVLPVLDLDERGVLGDRAHALWLRGDRRVSARQVPGTLRWAARYDAPVDGTIPPPAVTAPDGTTRRWDDPDLPRALSDDLGEDVAIVSDPRGMQDVGRTVLVTFEATRAQLELEIGEPVDLRRLRPNIHVIADAAPWAENDLTGRTIRVGDAELEVLDACPRCAIVARDPDTNEKSPAPLQRLVSHHDELFGIHARPAGPATVRVGDPVAL
jgi:uncharacterized protein